MHAQGNYSLEFWTIWLLYPLLLHYTGTWFEVGHDDLIEDQITCTTYTHM